MVATGLVAEVLPFVGVVAVAVLAAQVLTQRPARVALAVLAVRPVSTTWQQAVPVVAAVVVALLVARLPTAAVLAVVLR